ncbi:tRNA (guanosine(46)-N7)-methyltransferase TrmB [Arcobacter sp. HD9-500m-PIT-SAG03]|nr:tRNA (guanosine(46)-N7)-methyltransferase TrmB [Arcobacter sp. HD9-500m-PIT-SAG03]
MPHIQFKKNDLIKTPIQENGVFFDFCAKSYNFTDKQKQTEYKIAVKYKERDFLLTLREKENTYMVKVDNITRVSPIDIIKEAINAYAKVTNAEIEFSNTSNFKNTEEPIKEYIKDIEYFVNDFNPTSEVQVEVGFGSGRHILHQALENPDVQFIGLEIHTPSIEQLLKQISIQGIKNILVINYDARLFMEFLKSNSVEKIFVHFPVPWDKKPHRRIYSDDFINEALRVLKVDGSLELRTDSRKYFDYCTHLLTNLNSGRIVIDINKDLGVSSKYEDRWKKQGKNIYDVVLLCAQEDEEKQITENFDFENEIYFEQVRKSIQTKPIVREDYFLHIEDIFIDKNGIVLLRLTFGSFNRPLSKYIIIRDNKISYYQGNPIPTSANLKAHLELKKILSNDNS